MSESTKQKKSASPDKSTQENPAPKKMGRPSKHAPELAREICERLSDGEPLRQICRDEHMPAWRTVYDWMAKDAELSTAIACARDLGGDAIAEDTLHIMDTTPEKIVDDKGIQRVDSGYVSWQKNRVELRLKLLAKWNPKKYGDRQIISGDAENPLAVKADVQLFDTVIKNVELTRQLK